MRELSFTLPFALASLNVRQRQHWAVLHRSQADMAMEVMTAIGGPRHYPRPPFERARITVLRLSAGQLDPDNAAAACKPLLDALCVRSPRHPTGQGIIVDDAPTLIELVVRQDVAPRGDGVTVIRIEDLGPMPLAVATKRNRYKAPRKPTLDQIQRVTATTLKTLPR